MVNSINGAQQAKFAIVGFRNILPENATERDENGVREVTTAHLFCQTPLMGKGTGSVDMKM